MGLGCRRATGRRHDCWALTDLSSVEIRKDHINVADPAYVDTKAITPLTTPTAKELPFRGTRLVR